jgi:c-di-GMP-related signal transduction protein
MKFIARRPIFVRERKFYACELLFRFGIRNTCEGINPEQAFASMLDSSFLIGRQRLISGNLDELISLPKSLQAMK